MKLHPYQQRVIQEKSDLDDKLSKLDAFVRTDLFVSLSAEERRRLYRQLSLMEQYSSILGERIAAFSENLNEQE